MIDRHPVHRHRWARSAVSTWAEEGSGGSADKRQRSPGVQNPHWEAPWLTKEPTRRAATCSGRPSTVVTERPAMRRSGVTQATRGAPSTSTVQQPH
jgi:hypothetical protein